MVCVCVGGGGAGQGHAVCSDSQAYGRMCVDSVALSRLMHGWWINSMQRCLGAWMAVRTHAAARQCGAVLSTPHAI